MTLFWLLPAALVVLVTIQVLYRPKWEFEEVERRQRAIDALRKVYGDSERDRVSHDGDRPAGGPECPDQGWAGRFRVVGGGAERSARTAEAEEALASGDGAP